MEEGVQPQTAVYTIAQIITTIGQRLKASIWCQKSKQNCRSLTSWSQAKAMEMQFSQATMARHSSHFMCLWARSFLPMWQQMCLMQRHLTWTGVNLELGSLVRSCSGKMFFCTQDSEDRNSFGHDPGETPGPFVWQKAKATWSATTTNPNHSHTRSFCLHFFKNENYGPFIEFLVLKFSLSLPL